MDPVTLIGSAALRGAASWAWDAIGEDLAFAMVKALGSSAGKGVGVSAGQSGAKLWTSAKWKLAADEYRTKVAQTVGTTRLLFHPKSVNLSKIFTDVKVFDKDTAFRYSRLSISDPAQMQAHEDSFPRRSALEAVRTGNHLYILGRPGAGKTTLLKHIAFLACTGELEKTPIFIELRSCRLELEKPVLTAVEHEFAICNFPEPGRFVDKLLREGKAILLVDGLDEVPEANGARQRLISDLVLLARQYPKSQICVTCRIASTEYTFERFDYLEIADFSDEQKLIFARNWFADDPTKLQRFEEQWGRRENSGLRELGRTPLLLALICLTFDETLEIPRRQVDLYREALEALLRKWDSSRNVSRDPFYMNLQPSRREQLLAEIAVETCSRRSILFTTDEVSGLIATWYSKLPGNVALSKDESLAVARDIESQHGLLVQRSKDLYSFSHLSLQEFFAAQAVVSGRFFASTSEFVQKQFLASHWREVFVFACSIAPDATPLLRDMASQCARILDGLPYSRRLIEDVRTLAQERPGGGQEPQIDLFGPRMSVTSLVPSDTEFVALDDNALRKIQVCLEEIYEDLKLIGVVGARREIEVLYDLLERFQPQFAKTFGYSRRSSVRDVGAVSFLEFAESLRLLVQCITIAACSDREEIVLTALHGASSAN